MVSCSKRPYPELTEVTFSSSVIASTIDIEDLEFQEAVNKLAKLGNFKVVQNHNIKARVTLRIDDTPRGAIQRLADTYLLEVVDNGSELILYQLPKKTTF